MTAPDEPDRWLDWLIRGRDAGDPELRRRSDRFLHEVYARVLDGALLRHGDTVLEVGAGEGRLGLLALDRTGGSGRLILSDVSESVVENLRASAGDRATVVLSPVETLAGIADGSVDVVLSRSVLIYSSDVPAALRSAARVLRPGGRLSLFEPLWRFHPPPDDPADFFGWDLGPVAAEAAAVRAAYPASTAAPTAGTLVAAAEAAGFTRIRALVEAESGPPPPGDDAAVRQAVHGRPNPTAPSAAEAARAVLPPARAEAFERALEQAVRGGRGRLRSAAVHLTADLSRRDGPAG